MNDDQNKKINEIYNALNTILQTIFSMKFIESTWHSHGERCYFFAKKTRESLLVINKKITDGKVNCVDENGDIAYLAVLSQELFLLRGVIDTKDESKKNHINELLERIYYYSSAVSFDLTTGFIEKIYSESLSNHQIRGEDQLAALDRKIKESDDLLARMRLVEAAIVRKGLAGAYKNSADNLKLRVLGFDLLNYASLVLIFLLTTNVFNLASKAGLGWAYSGGFWYERLVLILPLVVLSWFSSKRSQFLYQIREEYAYKYSTALAYDGFRDEVKNNPAMEVSLMEMTIKNLARSPLEQFDKNSDHSPYLQVIKELRLKKE